MSIMTTLPTCAVRKITVHNNPIRKNDFFSRRVCGRRINDWLGPFGVGFASEADMSPAYTGRMHK